MNYSVGFNLYMNKVSCQASIRIIERAALAPIKDAELCCFYCFTTFLPFTIYMPLGKLLRSLDMRTPLSV